MTDKNLWALKQPIEASYYEDGLMAIEFEHISECLIITDEQFEQTFEPLDVESLTTQLEEILLGYSSHEYVRGFDAGKNWEGEDEPILRDVESLAEAVAEVLELIGMKGKQ